MLSVESCANCCALKKELDTLKKSNENFLLLKERIISTDDIIRRYQTKLVESANRTQQISELRKQYDLLKLKCDSAEEQLTRFLRSSDEAEKSKVEYESRIKALNAHISELEQQVNGEMATITILREQLAGKNELVSKSENFDNRMRIMDNKMKEYGRDKDEAVIEAAETKRSLKIAENKIKKYERILREKGLLDEESMEPETTETSFEDVEPSTSTAKKVKSPTKRKRTITESSQHSAKADAAKKKGAKAAKVEKKVTTSPPKAKSRRKKEKALTAEDWLGSKPAENEEIPASQQANAFISDSEIEEEEGESGLSNLADTPLSTSVKQTRALSPALSDDLPPLEQEPLGLPPGFESLFSSVEREESFLLSQPEPIATSTQIPKPREPVKPVTKPTTTTPSLGAKPSFSEKEKVTPSPSVSVREKPPLKTPISVQEPAKRPATLKPPSELSNLGLYLSDDSLSESEGEEVAPKKTAAEVPKKATEIVKESPRRPEPKPVTSVSIKKKVVETETASLMPPPPTPPVRVVTESQSARRPEPRHRASAGAILRGKAQTKSQPEKEKEIAQPEIKSKPPEKEATVPPLELGESSEPQKEQETEVVHKEKEPEKETTSADKQGEISKLPEKEHPEIATSEPQKEQEAGLSEPSLPIAQPQEIRPEKEIASKVSEMEVAVEKTDIFEPSLPTVQLQQDVQPETIEISEPLEKGPSAQSPVSIIPMEVGEPVEKEPEQETSSAPKVVEEISIQSSLSAVVQMEVSESQKETEISINSSTLIVTETVTPALTVVETTTTTETSTLITAKTVKPSDSTRTETDVESVLSSPRALAIVESSEVEEDVEKEPVLPKIVEEDVRKEIEEESDSSASSPGGFVIDEPEEVEEPAPVESEQKEKEPPPPPLETGGDVEEGEIADEERESPASPSPPPPPPPKEDAGKSPRQSLPGARDILNMSLPFDPLSPIREVRRRLSLQEIFSSIEIRELVQPPIEPVEAAPAFKKPSPQSIPKPRKVATAKPGIVTPGVVRNRGRTNIVSK